MKFYAKSPGNEGYIKNMEVVSFHDADNHYPSDTRHRKASTTCMGAASSDMGSR